MRANKLKLFLRTGFLTALIVLILATRYSAQEQATGLRNTEIGQPLPSSIVSYWSEGGASYRAMTGQEKNYYHSKGGDVTLHAIAAKADSAASAPTQNQATWKIILRGTRQLDGYPEAKAAFIRAAAKFEALFQSRMSDPSDSPTVEVDVDFGDEWFGVPYQSASIISLNELQRAGFFPITTDIYDFMGMRATDPQQALIYKALPLPIKTEQGDAGLVLWTSPVEQALFLFSTGRSGRQAIGFNAATKFDFDPSNGIDADKLDFEAAVGRELGRLFGFNSRVGASELDPTPLPSRDGPMSTVLQVVDLYRFRPGVTMETFAAAPRVLRSGGEQIFFTGDLELPLSTGRPDGTGGDGRPAGSWKDDELTGQYLGIMDPTLTPGLRGGITANDLTVFRYFTYAITPGTDVVDVLSNDDNSREETLAANGSLLVNRFTPARYPFTLQSVRVQLPANGASPVGQPLRIVVFADAARTGQPPANPQLLVDRTINIPSLPEHRWLEVMIPTGPTVASGDLYVGVQANSASLSFAGDSSGAQRNRSFLSTNGSASFAPLRNGQNAPLNLMLRAVMTEKFDGGNNLTPELATLSPNAAPTGAGFDLYVSGRDFKPETIDGSGFHSKSVVRWNGQERETTFLSPSLLRARITAADLAGGNSARVTVLTTGADGGRESAALTFNVSNDRPAPVLARLDQPVIAAGGAQTKLLIFGRNFTAQSVAQLNAAPRATRFVNSTAIEATLTASDLATAANYEITAQTPAPGGGASNALSLRVAGCSFRLSRTSLTVGAAPQEGEGGAENGEINLHGVSLETQDYCSWTVRNDSKWVLLTGTSGTGSGPIGFNLLDNPGAAARTGHLSVGDQTFTVTQLGSPTAVSAASYGQGSAPESIASLFGINLARTTQVATGLPLPTTLAGTQVTVLRFGTAGPQLAPLFFVSPTQINFMVPPTAPGDLPVRPLGSRVHLSVKVDGQLVADGYITLAPVVPGLFSATASGSGLAAAVVLRVKADGTQSYEPVAVFDERQNKLVARPIDLGPQGEHVFLTLFGTGIRGRSQLSEASVKIGGLSVPALYAGAQGDFAGLDQVNIELPGALRGRGEVPVIVFTDRVFSSNTVTVTIK